MSAHLNITSTIATEYGITLASGAVADDASKTSSVEVSEVLSTDTAAVIHVAPLHMAKVETQVSGEGPHDLALTAGTVATPSTLTKISVELGETTNGRCTFTARAAGHAAFTDPAETPAEVGAEPTIADLLVTSVEYSIVESVRRTSTLEDKVLAGTDGGPAARATCTPRRTFSIVGRGDKPAGLVLGTGGAEFVGATTGLVLVTSLMEGEKRGDWNRHSADGRHDLAA